MSSPDNLDLRYSRFLLGTVALVLAALACFTGWVDPYLLFHEDDGRNRLRVLNERQGFAKPLQALTRPATTLLMGSSRVLQGIDPRHIEGGGADVFNYAVSGQRIIDAEARLIHALRWKSIDLVCWGVDMELFTNGVATTGDFDGSVRRADFVLNSVPTAFVGSAAVTDSLRVLEAHKSPLRWHWLGNRDRRDEDDWDKSIAAMLKKWNIPDIPPRDEAFASLERIIDLCAEKGARLVIFSQPACHELTDAYRLTTRWEDLSGVSAAIAERVRAKGVQYLDLGGYSEPGSPLAGLRREFFFDALHYRPYVGDSILERLGFELREERKRARDASWEAALRKGEER